MRKAKSLLWTAAFLATALLPMCLRAEEGPPPADQVASLTAGPAGLDWLPLVSHERMVLVIAGPDGLTLRQEFESGKAPSLGLFDQDGNRLPDGSYSWELRVIPRIDTATRERLNRARVAEDDSVLEKLRSSGKLPERPLVQSGYFSIQGGNFVTVAPTDVVAADRPSPSLRNTADKQVIAEDLVVEGGACVGYLCEDGDAFLQGLRVKSTAPAILFDDVYDQLTADRNWSLRVGVMGQGDRLYISDDVGGSQPFSIEGGAPYNALWIRSNGNLGLGTAVPAQDIHAVSGNSPAIRLEQDGTGGPAARIWDAVGNEVGFFVRDVTNSSSVPFRIQAGAPTGSLEVSSSGQVGIGTTSPAAPLHIYAGATSDTWIGVGPSPGSGPALNFGYAGASNGRGAAFLNVRPDASATAPNPSLRFLVSNTERMIIDNEGYVGLGVANPTKPIEHSSGAYLSTGGTWTNASSRLVKHDIQNLDAADARAALAGLAPVRFRYNAEPDDEFLGFIAEDVPELVATSDHKSLSPMDIVAVLTKMVQEQERTIEELKTRLEELESRQP
ncbi:MAG TPA: tail fiber domain-containing protein [Thermoanaerobaculia bacterium]|nr:tail fiber domain-containing protein [Thermoanaerobaculia bacterium]